MTTAQLLDMLNKGERIVLGSEPHKIMSFLSVQAMEITMELNTSYNSGEEIVDIMSKLTGKPVDPSFRLFPPFYTDCGKNTTFGKYVFINSGCHFQDQGGITIGDHTHIGHCVTLATLNHDLNPEKRGDTIPSPINIGKNVWIGSNATILPGVTIGDNSVIGAGSVVTKDVPANTVAAGVPAKIIKEIEWEETK